MDIAGGAGVSGGSDAPQQAPAAAPHTGLTFHDVLTALNPLQYLPVVGTIYRALAGDAVSEPMRVFGSIAVSAVTGGPVGMLLNLGSTILEKVTGIDPDRIAHRVLVAVGVLDPDPAPAPVEVAKVRAGPPAPEPAGGVAEAGDAADAARARQAADAYGKAQALAA